MCAFIKKDISRHSVLDVVCANTGMTEEQLMEDVTDYEVKNLGQAAEIINAAIENGRRIYVFSDYDCDGQTSSAILFLAMRRTPRGRFGLRLPRRFSEGYGVTVEAINEFEDSSLLILVDNGIVAFDAIERAKEKDMTVIVLDHHLPETDEDGNAILPKADVIVDPHVFPGSFNDYCGAGLSYKLAFLLNTFSEMWKPAITAYAAIGTICDAVPLTGENRRIVREGLKIMSETPECLPYGMRALMRKLDISGHIDAKCIGFKIGPCLNAPARLLDNGALDSVGLLLEYISVKSARYRADRLIEFNERRRSLTEEWFEKTKDAITSSKMSSDYPIVVYMPGIPEGIIGIIAGKIAEEYHAPAFIFSGEESDAMIKGSARSDGRIHLKNLLNKHSDLIEKYGGHCGAAGITVRKSNLDIFREKLLEELKDCSREECRDTLYDLEIERISDVPEIVRELERLAPFGEGNPSPVFLVKDLTVISNAGEHYKLLSSNGLKLQLGPFSAFTFDCAEKYLSLGAPRRIDLVGMLSENHFKGNVTTQMEFIDVEPSEEKMVKTSLLKALEEKALERCS